MKITLVLSGVVLLASGLPTEGRADAEDDARSLAVKGKSAVEKGDFEGGCPLLERAFSQDPTLLGAGYTLASCRERQGKLASARALYLEIADKARARGEARAKEAQARADAMKERVSTLTIRLPDAVASAAGVSVMLGPTVLKGTDLGQPKEVDGGSITITVRAAGHEDWVHTVEVPPERGRLVIDARLGARPGAALPPPVPPASVENRVPLWIPGVAVSGLGLVGMGLFVGFGLSAKATDDDLEARCGVTCPESERPLAEEGERDALVANVSLGVGAAALATGAILFIVEGMREAPARSDAVQIGVPGFDQAAGLTYEIHFD